MNKEFVLDQAIREKKWVKQNSGKIIQPVRVTTISGKLSLIYINIENEVLEFIQLSQLADLTLTKAKNYFRVSLSQIEQLLRSIRSMDNTEQRLVLKFYHFEYIEGFENALKHDFIRNKYRTQNSKGQVIWSASVEESQSLFEKLLSFSSCFEILSTDKLKSSYLNFCQTKIKEIA